MRLLGHSPVTALGEEPERWVVFVHGILGKRANWRGIARRMVEARPDLGGLLVDLRMHGDSLGFAPPHTVDAAARDLLPLMKELNTLAAVIVGHSFGGKVALAYVKHAEHKPKQVWTLDSVPGPLENPSESGAAGVLRFLKGAPTHYAKREDFIEYAVQQGLSQSVATWLAMNLTRCRTEGFKLALDIGAIEALMRDYATQDLWPLLEDAKQAVDYHLVIATQSNTYSQANRERAKRAAESQSHVHTHLINASHWLHVEEPAQLVELLVSSIPRSV
ncbi:MAG: alpha/beta hydrolase [Myxococcales bacterium]|nr:alpha/beta hydrolase [Myxococcales bacterium]